MEIAGTDSALPERDDSPPRGVVAGRRSRRVRALRFGVKACVFGAMLVLAYLGGNRLHRWYLAAQTYPPAPEGMVLVPAGEFWMGSDDAQADPDERPLRSEFLRAYYIDVHEVTNREYKAIVPTHTYPAGADDLPATHILKHEAEAYARSMGKRLPTNAEWEKAARGVDGRRYPWGDDYVKGKSNIGLGEELKPVGSFPEGNSPYGCEDMAGNAWEWVADTYYDTSLLNFDLTGVRGVIRGGAHGYGPYQARTSYMGFEALDSTCNDVGFRCVQDAEPQGS